MVDDMPGFCVTLEHAGRKFGKDWIFRRLNAVFREDSPTVILGTNGTGKSTLLNLISGKLTPSEGRVHYTKDNHSIPEDSWHRHLSIAAPYLELPEELTCSEVIRFQSKLKAFRNDMKVNDVLNASALSAHRNKVITQLSSGMKQRLKLALAVYAKTRILLLDEPATNLDSATINWYREVVQMTARNRIIIVCSNFREEEYPFSKNRLEITHFKR